MKIRLTEEQYKRIFLEQDQSTWQTNYDDMIKSELEKNQMGNYDPSGGIGAARQASNLPNFGSTKGDYEGLLNKMKPGGKRHDSACSSDQIKFCKSKGSIGTNIKQKGRDWDIELGYAVKDTKGNWNTSAKGLWDNEWYTKCACRKGQVKVTERKSFDPTANNYEGAEVTLQDTEFIIGPATITKSNFDWDKWKKMGDYEKNIYNQQQYSKYAITNRKVQRLAYDPVKEFIRENRHEIIDILAVAAFFIPVVGPFISVGLEGVNTAMYYQEGDNVSGTMSAVFMLIPFGGPILRRVTTPAIKQTDKFFKYVLKVEKMTNIDEKAKKELADKAFEKLGKTEKELVQELRKPENVVKLKEFEDLGEGGVKQYLKKNKNLWEDVLSKETSFGKGSKFWERFAQPTMMEKYVFAGSVLGMIYLDKSGKMEILTQNITKWLMEVRGISQEEAPIVIINLEETIKKYEKKLTSTPVDQRDVIIMEMAVEIEVKMDYIGNLPKNHPSRKKLMSISDTDKIKIVNKKLKKLKVVDYSSLGEWDSVWYKNYCSKNKSVTLPSNVTIIDLQERLTNSPDGEIKSKHLGNNWEYGKLDGLWFTRKVNTEEWLLVTKCVANNKIEVEYEKVVDPDVDKKAEFDTLMDQHLKNAGFDINQYIGLFNDEKK